MPGGRLLVAVVGLAVLALATRNVWTGATDRFLENVDRDSLTGRTRTVVVTAGRTGFVARGAAYAVIGLLFLLAAWRGSAPDEVAQ